MSILICGIDEAGRGPLAGPVCAAAVILPENFPSGKLDDSKKLSSSSRDALKEIIFQSALAWGIGWASAAEIDAINIHNATLLAMKRAFENAALPNVKIRAIVDGRFAPDISIPCEPMVKADTLIPAVMAASILAKTTRDRLMESYALFYPEYGYEKHKGYPTKKHREVIQRCGPSPIQRMSFRVL